MAETKYGRRCLGTVAVMAGVHSLPTPFVKSLVYMQQFNHEYIEKDGEFVHYDFLDTISYHENMRNEASKRMMGDWLLQLDTDHSFDPDLLSRLLTLLDAYNLPMIGANYFKKGEPHFPVVVKWNQELEKLVIDVDKDTGRLRWKAGDALFPTDAGGGGGLLVRKEVFDRVRKEFQCEPFEAITPWKEDYSFFMRCKDLEIPYHISPRVQMPYLVWGGIEEKDYIEKGKEWGVEYGEDET